MKSNKIFRILSIAVILALLVVVLPASPALAGEDLDLSPSKGKIGDRIDVEGYDFNRSTDTDTVFVYIIMSPEDADVDDDDVDQLDTYERVKTKSTDTSGDFETYFNIPSRLNDGDDDEDVVRGTYYIYTAYSLTGEIKSQDTLTVIAPEVTLSPDNGFVGETVTIDGIDFDEGEDIEVEYDDDEIDIESGDDETDSSGDFAFTIIIPDSTADEHTIKVTAGDSVAEAEFDVEPDIKLSTESGAPGDNVTVSGTGFGKNVDVTIEFDNDDVADGDTDDYGSFDISFKVPVKISDSYTVEAQDDDRNKAEVSFEIAAGIELDQQAGNVGSQITVSGSGFTPNAAVDINYSPLTVPVATVTADADGKFSTTFTVPKSAAGEHNVTATDGTNISPSIPFTMEKTPPPVPQPLLPYEGDKAKSQATFEWEAVSDPSEPVTYSLVVTAADGTELVRQTGIAETAYTLTKEEKLESTKKEAPYYWSIEAVDAAGNRSGWTFPSPFYVGFTFELTGWVLYVLMGIAALILFLIGVLLGRRLAYY